MEIKVGWSAEIHGRWDKLDIVVEELDLQRLFIEANFPEVPKNLRIVDSFRLMEGMADKLITSYRAKRHPDTFPVAEARAALLAIREAEEKILDSYRV